MILVSLLIILFLEYQFKISQQMASRLQSHRWLRDWHDLIVGKSAETRPELIFSLIILLPVLLVFWLTSLEGGFFLWLFQFLLTLFVLSYALGPIDQNQHLSAYFEAVERQDFQAAFIEVQENLNQKSCQIAPEDFESLGRLVTELILRQCNFRLFGVLFYFILLGIAGALAYTLICNLEFYVRDNEQSRVKDTARKVRAVVDWLPQRITALLYGLAGDFNGAMAQFLPFAFKSTELSAGMLENTGLGAMGIDVSHREDEVITENREALALVSRSTKVFILIIAIMTVFGWLH